MVAMKVSRSVCAAARRLCWEEQATQNQLELAGIVFLFSCRNRPWVFPCQGFTVIITEERTLSFTSLYKIKEIVQVFSRCHINHPSLAFWCANTSYVSLKQRRVEADAKHRACEKLVAHPFNNFCRNTASSHCRFIYGFRDQCAV